MTDTSTQTPAAADARARRATWLPPRMMRLRAADAATGQGPRADDQVNFS